MRARLLFSLFIFLGLWAGSFPAHASKLKSCIVSLVDDESLDRSIYSDSIRLLQSMGYEDAKDRLAYFTDIRALRLCLQGPYEEVILIAHSIAPTDQAQAIYYTYQNSKGEKVGQYLDQRIFQNFAVSPNLRQITLMNCEAEKVVENYQALLQLAKNNNVYLKLQPANIFSQAVGAQWRTENLFAQTIAESAQDENANSIYCTLRTNVMGILEVGKTSCLRNHFEVRFAAPLAVGLKTTTRWLKLKASDEADGEDNFSWLNLELGLFRGLSLGGAKDPLAFNKDSYGVSFSFFNHVHVLRQRERQFGYSGAK